MKKLRFAPIILGCLFLLPYSGWSQYVINGSTIDLGSNCYQLTPPATYQGGAVWFQNKVTLTEDLRVQGTLNLGSIDGGGADGIAFVLQPVCSGLGSLGGGLGYLGISPSLAIEFDSWQNGEYADPIDDHIALMSNGVISHNTPNNLSGPYVYSNLEDGLDHSFDIQWDAGTTTLTLIFDGSTVFNYSDDIVTSIFAGNDNVFWGFTAATGAAVNYQTVCISDVLFTEDGSYLVTHPSCPDFDNGSIDLDPAGGIEPITYLWSNGEVTEDISGLTEGEYSVTVTDGNGCQTVYTIELLNAVDDEAPVLNCPDITVNNDPGECGARVYYNITSTDNCPVTYLEGFTYIGTMGGSSYFVSDNSFTWTGALAHSQANGLHMATITSAEENDFVVNGLISSGLISTNPWIGLSDDVVEGEFRWINGEAFSYSNWGPGEPNNLGGEHYTNYLFNGVSAQWNDLPDDLGFGWTPNPYIIELEGTQVFLQAGYYSGAIFPKGTTTVTYQAVDASGNTAECSFNVTVIDADNSCGCTYSQGYWKTHSEFGPAPYDETWGMLPDGASTIFFLSGQSYYNVLWTSPAGNAYYILAHQYIATQLNFLSGAYPVAAQDAFDEATGLFSLYTPAQIKAMKSNNPVRQRFLALASILDDYNNGIIGPGHCEDEGEKAAEAGITIQQPGSGLKVYPNPVSESATIEFTVSEEARTTVELYNMVGQKMEKLFDEMTLAGNTYQVVFNAGSYNKGIYLVVVKSGNNIKQERISIGN